MFHKIRDRLTLLALVVVALAAGTSACTGPCETLANQICDCRPNRTEQDQCKQQVIAGRGQTVTSDEDSVCDALLDSCTCEALERNDLAACGLAPQPK